MANDLTASFPEYWSRRLQAKRYVEAVYVAISNFEEKLTLKKGDTCHRPYRSDLVVNDVGTGGSYTRQDITTTDEYLTIDQEKEVSFYVKDADRIQSNYNDANEYADEAAIRLTLQIDGDVLADAAANAASSVDDGDLGGTSGDGITLTTSNVLNVISKARLKLKRKHAPAKGRWMVVSPEFMDILWQYLAGKDTSWADQAGKNGRIGQFNGFTLYESEATYWTGELKMATNPTANDTVTINGVTFKFVASPSAAGDVDIGSDADESRDNLVAAINGGAGAGTKYIEVSTSDRKKLKNITATNDSSNNKITVVAKGKGYVPVSETLTASNDVWTPEKQIQHCLAGWGKPIDVVIQKYPKLEIKDRSGYIGKDFVTWCLYGIKTFSEGADMLVDIKIRSDGF